MTAATDEARAQTDAPQINRILNTWAVARNVRFTDVDMAYLRNYLLAMLREARDDGARGMRDDLAAWLRAQAEERRVTSPDKAADIESYAHILAATKLPSETEK